MRYRLLGKTGLSVSSIGFGASPLGGTFGFSDPAQGRAAVYCAIEAGINLFDVSPYYGLTLAEERLGAALEGHRQQVILATKCGRYGSDKFDFSAETVTLEFENSLLRLKTDYVDILQVHDIEFGSMTEIENETLPALRRLQEQGKVRFVGITGYWPELLTDLAGKVPVDTVLNYCHANLLMNDMDLELTPLAARLGIGLMNASPLHMGLLGGQPVPEWHPAPPDVRKTAGEIVLLCRKHAVSPATLALQQCLEHKVVASTFTGFKNVAEVEDALGALTFTPPQELLANIRLLAAPIFNRTWPSGIPENQTIEQTCAN